jgi:alpha-tubulin suppressor-like RCC1 family protein
VLIGASLAPIAGASKAFATTLPTVGIVETFGANSYGELGINSMTDAHTPAAVTGLPNGVAVIAAGARHSLAILSDSSVVAWGRDTSGELGINTTDPNNPALTTCNAGGDVCSLTPVHVTATSGSGQLTGAIAVAAGAPACTNTIPCTSHAGHSMALLDDNSVVGWGHDNSGQVGDGVSLPVPTGTNVDVLHPVPVVNLGAGSTSAIAAGASFSLAAKTDGSVVAWGNNASGELGNGGAVPGVDASTPQAVVGLGPSVSNPVIAVSAGDAFSVALKQDGSVWTWGNNASGELGNGTAGTDSSTPHQVKNLGPSTTNPVIAISAGSAFAVALQKDGAVVAWGNNASGELGNGTTTDSITPVTAVSSGISEIATGSAHVLAKKGSTHTMLVWGHGASGQLGNNGTVDVLKPKALSLKGVTRIAAGGGHSLVTLQPLVTVAPTSGVAGSVVSIASSRFAPGETVDVEYQTGLALPTQVQLCAPVASSTGTISCPSAVIPGASAGYAGTHKILATGETSGLPGVGSFKLRPSDAIAPTSGPKGTAVTITGSHFVPGESVTVKYSTGLRSPSTITLCTPMATSTGTTSCSTHIPSTSVGATGNHKISEIGAVSKLTASTFFQLT